jgi:V-type H+-transporting ATPase subunit H
MTEVVSDVAAGLLRGGGEGGGEGFESAKFYTSLLNFTPKWEKYPATSAKAVVLKGKTIESPAAEMKAVMQGELSILVSLIENLVAMGGDQEAVTTAQWTLTLLYNMLREDSSCFALYEDILKGQNSFKPTLMTLLKKQDIDRYVADKGAWLLSAAIGNVAGAFSDQDVSAFLGCLLEKNGKTGTSPLGTLDAITNILKSSKFRKLVWGTPGVPDVIFSFLHAASSSQELYKSVFSIWMLSFDSEITKELMSQGVIEKIKSVLAGTRVEKVVRLCLTLMKNFLADKSMCEDIVEKGLLEVVQQLEFEKWRDSDLYDDIRDTSSSISSEVAEMSNFDRYEKELRSGKLSWGFIHSSKFWGENVMKFDKNDFDALKRLRGVLEDEDKDPVSLAVACHDIGEFVALHPLGKKKVAELNIKMFVMKHMQDQSDREVRREALLCCQKIMLNKWQDMDTSK